MLVQLRGICQTDFATVMAGTLGGWEAGTLLLKIPLVVIFILTGWRFHRQ
jgi:hypothetical protein